VLSVLAAARDEAPDVTLDTQAVAAMATSLGERLDALAAASERAHGVFAGRVRVLLVLLFAAGVLVALQFFRVVLREVTAVLPAIEAGMHEVAAGRLGATVKLAGATPGDEIGHVATAFDEMSRELERLDRLKSEFVSNVSHELRTPLAAMLGYADLVARGIYGPIAPGVATAVDSIKRRGRDLTALIGDILDLAKIEAGKLAIRKAPVDPRRLAADALDSVRPQADAKGLEVALEASADAPAAIATDEARVRQVLLNFLSNAVKFTDRGRVTVRVRKGPRALCLEVEDTGIGIKPEERPRLFGRFEQLDGSSTRRHGGTGLGLHISKRLAELMGGAIEVESEPGKGARFALHLPDLADDERGPAEGPAGGPGATEVKP
jgi:signal transduction histidine kinase